MVRTRKELATMTDAEILVHYRREHGDPYMPLSVAKEMRHADYKWLHDTLAWEKRKREEREEAERQLRAKVFGSEVAAMIDWEVMRAAAEEFGYWPASTDPEHLEKLREDNRRHDLMNAHDPGGKRWRKMGKAMGPK